jgi:glycolate oxidase
MLTSAVKEELEAIVGKERFLTDSQTRVTHSYDATSGHQYLPDGVIYPVSTEEVSAILRICSRHRIPVVSRGSGTNLSASAVPVKGGLVMVMTRMNRILEIDQENLTATVEPGVITQHLHQAVEKLGLFYPPDPGSMAISTIGGNIALGSGGLRGLKYGTTRDYVLGLEAVLASGDVIRTGGKLTKDVAGYDLTRLLVGSEGTLAVITKAILKLLPKPEYRRVATAFFNRLENAAKAVSGIISGRIIPCTLEFLDQGTMRVVEEFSRIGLPVDMGAMLIMEQDGPKELVDRDLEKMASVCRENGAVRVQVADSEEEGAKLLHARRTALSALARATPTTILEDATVPRAAIPQMVRRISEIAKKYDVRICTFGHAGDGNLHPTCMTDIRNREEMERVHQAFADIFAAALELGGTITGEHGVGLAKAPFLEWQLGPQGMQLLKNIKQAFDPHHILNPGKMFESPAHPGGGWACPGNPA